jgi:uncharacterized repeat protein (TIGR02543 family)
VNSAITATNTYTVNAAQVAVPSVVGLTESAASSALTAVGLVVGTISTQSSSTVPSGSVISQNPPAATEVNVGSSVNLVVSTGPATYVLTTAASPTSGGTVTPASGNLYAASTVVSLTAKPKPGYVFSSWTSSPAAVANASKASTTVTMSAAPQNETANFIFALSLNPTSLNFGTVYKGTTTVKDVTITNKGTASVTISKPEVSNVTEGDSKEYVLSNGCPESLAALKSCKIKVSFVAGAFYEQQSAMLTVTGPPGIAQEVSIGALVIDPKVKLSETSLSFGEEKENESSAAKSVKLTNSGATPLTIDSIAIAGKDPKDFEQTNNCPSSLTAGADCTIKVTFKPTAKGSRSAKLAIEDNAQSKSQSVSLSGTGD